MALGIIFRKNIDYHGPNAKSISREVYINDDGKCIKYGIKLI